MMRLRFYWRRLLGKREVRRQLGVIHRVDGTTESVTFEEVRDYRDMSTTLHDFRTSDHAPLVLHPGDRVVGTVEAP